MKETPLSLCERTSLIENLKAHIRLDGRSFLEIRPIEINFGKDYGCCTVSLGETRVLSQVTCEVVEPRPSRPNEGKLSIAVHLSPMAAPHFEMGRGIELIDELQQMLDRNIKESRCLDVESLCIMAEESVWQFRVDVTVLNHGGNLGDACNLAAVAALRHFHRPDVTVEEDGRVTIHTHEERELIPTFLKKIPVCLTYALFMIDKHCIILMDPSEKEERGMSGKFIVGLNPHGEITSLIFPGKVCLEKHTIMSCVSKAFGKAKSIAETVMTLVEEDLEKRKTSVKVQGYLGNLKSDTEYYKSFLMKKMEGVRGLDVKRKVRRLHPKDDKMEISDQGTTEDGRRGINDEEAATMYDSSDEEFSPDLLAKSLPEIKEEKKKKKSKTKKGKLGFIEKKNETSDPKCKNDPKGMNVDTVMMESSDEEFSPDLLSKNLTQIKEEKKAKSKTKKDKLGLKEKKNDKST